MIVQSEAHHCIPVLGQGGRPLLCIWSEQDQLLSQVRARIGTRATETTTRDMAIKATATVDTVATAITTTLLVTMDTAPDMTTVSDKSMNSFHQSSDYFGNFCGFESILYLMT